MIDTIISSSVLILIILAIRVVFRGKLNPMVQYGLWSLPALRLVIFSWMDLYPIKSPLSVMNATGNAMATVRDASAVEQVLRGAADARPIDNAVLILENIRTGVTVSGDGISPAAAVDWQLVIFILWAAGTIALATWLIFVNVNFGKKLLDNRKFLMHVRADGKTGSEPITLNESHLPGAKVQLLPVYVSGFLESPCLTECRGEAAIYITPEVAADKEKLQYAILHELCHYRHHDLRWSSLRGVLLALYWFNPLVWIAAIVSKRDCELACDYAVIKEIGDENRLLYGKALVDLINVRRQKSNVFHTATTMCGSAGSIKERVTMIAKNNKMKKTTLVSILLIAALAAGCTFTAASSGSLIDPDEEDIAAFASKWADAFVERDAETIRELSADEELYLTIGGITEDGEYWMGMSSPWPWYKDYVMEILGASTIEIYYYFRTSTPSIYVAKETLTVEKIAGEYKAAASDWKHFDRIESKADFMEAYKHKFPDFWELAPTYQFQADKDPSRKEILENPVTAAIEQLNLFGAEVKGSYEDPDTKKAWVDFAWDDGQITVYLAQPVFTDENGDSRRATIWVADGEE